MKKRQITIKQYCNILKKEVGLEVEQTFAPAGIGQQGGEWVSGKKDCSNQEECYSKKMDCKWSGYGHSEKDPLVDVAKNKVRLFPF